MYEGVVNTRHFLLVLNLCDYFPLCFLCNFILLDVRVVIKGPVKPVYPQLKSTLVVNKGLRGFPFYSVWIGTSIRCCRCFCCVDIEENRKHFIRWKFSVYKPFGTSELSQHENCYTMLRRISFSSDSEAVFDPNHERATQRLDFWKTPVWTSRQSWRLQQWKMFVYAEAKTSHEKKKVFRFGCYGLGVEIVEQLLLWCFVITIHEFIGVIEQKINLTFASSCSLSLHQRISISYSCLEAPNYFRFLLHLHIFSTSSWVCEHSFADCFNGKSILWLLKLINIQTWVKKQRGFRRRE